MTKEPGFYSRPLMVAIICIGGLALVCLIFQLGLMVGYQKANFSYRWGENYHRNFGGPRGGFMNMMRDDDSIEGHGVFGQIMTIQGSTLTVKGQYDKEISIIVTDKTVIKRFQKTQSLQDLKVDESIVIIGEPHISGAIEAKFIRVMPSRPSGKTLVPWTQYQSKRGGI